MINLGYLGEDSNIFELAATYVEYSFLPLFQTYKKKSTSADGATGSNTGIEGVEKNLMQLKVHLVQCQQNLDIPEIELIIDSDIRAKAEECKAKGKELTEEDFESMMNDQAFLNRL